MVKLLIMVALVTLAVMAEGLRIGDQINGKLHFPKMDVNNFLKRRAPYPEPEIFEKSPPGTTNIVEDWITQRLDNFDPVNDNTWEQRFVMTAEHFELGGCIFLFLAGEWILTEYRLENSLMAEMAEDFNCYIFYLEHRYYGQSRPTQNVTNENLRFLNVDQALADTAHFIEFIKSEAEYPGADDAPVIVIGGHYSASLAAWLRQSYPHLVAAAWASSAPTLAVADHFEYKELSGAVYRHIGGNECYNIIERGFAEMEQMVANGRNEELAGMFYLCNEIESDLDVQMFFSTISDFYSLLAQFDQIINIAGVCEMMADEDIVSDAKAIAEVLGYLLDGQCLEADYEGVVELERQTDWDAEGVQAGFRQYRYQSCTQFGWYHSSLSRFQPYGSSFPVEFFFQFCEDIFGEAYDAQNMLQNVERFNNLRGGLAPAATNVLYVHGQLDPWRSIGVQTTNHPDSPVIIITGASQGNDLGPSTDDDSDALVAAKLQIRDIIEEWISDDYIF